MVNRLITAEGLIHSAPLDIVNTEILHSVEVETFHFHLH